MPRPQYGTDPLGTRQSHATVHFPMPSSSTSHLNPPVSTTHPSVTLALSPSPVISPSAASRTLISLPSLPSPPSSPPPYLTLLLSSILLPRTRYIPSRSLTSKTRMLSLNSTSLDPLMCDSHPCTSAASPPGTYLAPFLCGEKAGGRAFRWECSWRFGGLKLGGLWNLGCWGVRRSSRGVPREGSEMGDWSRVSSPVSRMASFKSSPSSATTGSGFSSLSRQIGMPPSLGPLSSKSPAPLSPSPSKPLPLMPP